MTARSAGTLRTLLTVGIAVLLLLPTGVVATDTAQASTEDTEAAVEFVRTTDEIRGYLDASVDLHEQSRTDLAASVAAEPHEEHWSVIGTELSAVNETLANELDRELAAVSQYAANNSSAAYERHLNQSVYPLLDRAVQSAVDADTRDNASVQASIARDLLDRSIAEYHEGVSEGSVTDRAEYAVALTFAERSEARYESFVAGTLSEHANEELRELYERLHTAMNQQAGTEEAEQLAASIGGEYAEYTGIEVEQTGSTAAIERIEADLHAAVEAYEEGNVSEAQSLIKGTYLTNFEGIEGTLIAEDPELVEDLEAAFNEDLPALIDENASVSTVRERVETMESKLETAETILSDLEETDITLESPDTTTQSGEDANETATTTSSDTTSTTTPGFTIGAALTALVVVGLIRRRR